MIDPRPKCTHGDSILLSLARINHITQIGIEDNIRTLLQSSSLPVCAPHQTWVRVGNSCPPLATPRWYPGETEPTHEVEIYLLKLSKVQCLSGTWNLASC